MSLRARLALVLAGVMIGPLLAAAFAIGVVVPRAQAQDAERSAARAAAFFGQALTARCRDLGYDAERVGLRIALDYRKSGAAPLAGLARIHSREGAHDVPGATVVVLDADQQAIGAAGPDAGPVPGARAAQLAQASCVSRQVPREGDALVQHLPVRLGDSTLTVVAWLPLDAGHVATQRRELGIEEDVLLLDDRVRPSRQVSGTADPALSAAVRAAVAAGGRGGCLAAAGYHLRTGISGVPYDVAALAPLPGARLQIVLAVVVLLCSSVLIATVSLLAARFTRSLAWLAATAELFGAGDYSARSGIRGRDEVGRLAGAFDTMAADLQAKLAEIETSRDTVTDTFERFGEALGRTHDLDGLLRTVLEAAMHGAHAAVATALLHEPGQGLVERLSVVTDDSPELRTAIEPLVRLTHEAGSRAATLNRDELPFAGPAVALPLCRDGEVIGAIGVARRSRSDLFDPTSLLAVTALASHAGTAVANVRDHEETRRLSITDPLTGAGNFRHLTTTLAREVERASRFGRPLSVLMLDLDHFKQVNDTQGHAFGNVVLREFAHRLGDCLREVDTVARYGGEEFAVVLPETDGEGAARVAARIVEIVRAEPFRASGRQHAVTVSVGVAAFPEHGRTSAEVMRAADAALYAAKRSGRDRWCLAGTAAADQPVASLR